MNNKTQSTRYHKLLQYLDENYMNDLNIGKIEEICHYSYRNINRIFRARHQETIGKYIKRIRLEKAAMHLKYSEQSITDIAFNTGYEDVAAFSKAFKLKYACTPSAYRTSQLATSQEIAITLDPDQATKSNLSYEIVTIDPFDFCYLEHRGSYDDITAMQRIWDQLEQYASKNNLIKGHTQWMAFILDDNAITDNIRCRYQAALSIKTNMQKKVNAPFKIARHKAQRYARFRHVGSHQSAEETTNKIFAHWLQEVPHQLADRPIMEVYLNDDGYTPENELITDIYIAIQ